MMRLLLVTLLLLGTATAAADDFSLPDGVTNSQDPKDLPPTPAESLKKIKVPEGFSVTLFAGEPHVRQPIAFAIDDRGRLWVAECFSYREWKPEGRDRILIFEDTDRDGRFDTRKVFWDKGNYLTGLQLGFGGVWICNSPNFAFIPDRDGDDKPDGEPVVLLDGWSNKGVHNVPNGLTWGPDGWLYGMNGITSPSKVGKPGTPDDQRIDINCGVWRYHPTRHEFEVVAHGTTNPFGLDYDEHGQFFFTNCVIGHLWHLIPGAHYKRMFGQDYNPFVYDLIDQHADHLHWAGKDWTKTRGGKGEHDPLGGGHAHCGAMIYLGDNWPDSYRGKIFTCNVHGARVNCDRLQRDGSGYVGLHDKDFFFANDPWFRGVELKYGPTGDVYITDWTDLGECHDHDGVHRDSGRIYRVTHERGSDSAKLFRPGADMNAMSDQELVSMHVVTNEWWPRHARRILQERAAAGKLSPDALADLRRLATSDDVIKKLRALWTLHAVGETSEVLLLGDLEHDNEHVRSWSIRLLCGDRSPGPSVVDIFSQLSKDDPSALVRLGLASALQRLPLDDRWNIAENLLSHAEDAKDHNLPLMIWYGIEPLVPVDSTRALQLAVKSKIPLIRQYIARRTADK